MATDRIRRLPKILDPAPQGRLSVDWGIPAGRPAVKLCGHCGDPVTWAPPMAMCLGCGNAVLVRVEVKP